MRSKYGGHREVPKTETPQLAGRLGGYWSKGCRQSSRKGSGEAGLKNGWIFNWGTEIFGGGNSNIFISTPIWGDDEI